MGAHPEVFASPRQETHWYDVLPTARVRKMISRPYPRWPLMQRKDAIAGAGVVDKSPAYFDCARIPKTWRLICREQRLCLRSETRLTASSLHTGTNRVCAVSLTRESERQLARAFPRRKQGQHRRLYKFV